MAAGGVIGRFAFGFVVLDGHGEGIGLRFHLLTF